MNFICFKNILVLVIATTMSSCVLSKLDKTPAPPEDYWKKAGYEKKRIRNFLYENCGYLKRPQPNEFTNKNEFEVIYDNRLIEIEQCMLDNGFLFTLNGPATAGTSIWSNRCSDPRLKELPACLSLKTRVISTRTVTTNSTNSDNSNFGKVPAYITIDPDYDDAIRLQNDIKNQNNRQMNILLRNAAP